MSCNYCNLKHAIINLGRSFVVSKHFTRLSSASGNFRWDGELLRLSSHWRSCWTLPSHIPTFLVHFFQFLLVLYKFSDSYWHVSEEIRVTLPVGVAPTTIIIHAHG